MKTCYRCYQPLGDHYRYMCSACSAIVAAQKSSPAPRYDDEGNLLNGVPERDEYLIGNDGDRPARRL